MTLDVLIRGGWVIDGTGAPAYRADVGVSGDRITAIGRLGDAEAGEVIDATGRYVLPGLIDCHAHGDARVLDAEVQLAALRQGVTTFVVGQDGISYAPATTPAAAAFASRYFAAVNGSHPEVDGPLSVAELLATYDRRTRLNTAFLLPHGTIRFDAVGPVDRKATDEELAAMRRQVERGLSEGAVGLSTGLEYVPGRYADAAELAFLCEPLGAAPYVTHMRGYGESASLGMSEVVEIAELSGAAVHVSHYVGPAGTLLPLVGAARDRGVDLTFDTYPYMRASTILAMVVLPAHVPAADADRALPMIPEVDFGDVPWERLTISHAPGYEWAEGLSLPDAAEQVGADPASFCRTLLIGTRLEAGCVFARPDEGPVGEESVRAILRDPGHMGGSDGIYVGGHPHPRGFGSFARFLGRHVRELGDLTWEQAAVHLASHPARRFGLSDRGLVRTGMAADLAIVDPVRVADTANYGKPRSLAEGVDDVLVAGIPVLRDGTLSGATPGRPLRP